MAVGIPAGGLNAGLERIKTGEQAAIYGGTAGKSYDPCLHRPCDDITNIDVEALNEMSDGVAHATLAFAKARTLSSGPDQGVRSRSISERLLPRHLLRCPSDTCALAC